MKKHTDTYRASQHERTARASREAIEWLEVMRGAPDMAARQAFAAWIGASPLHVRELLLADMLERELSRDGLIDGFDVDAIVAQARITTDANVVALAPARTRANGRRNVPARHRTRGRFARYAAIAAVLLLVVVGWAGLSLRGADGTVYASVAGEQRSLALADGTRVMLAPRSSIRVHYSPALRSVELTRGEATFTVVHNAQRPFRVRAGATVVQDIGTRFSVNRLPSGTVVAVAEGEVRVTVDHLASLRSDLDTWLGSWAPGDDVQVGRADLRVKPLESALSLTAGESAHITRNGKFVAHDSVAERAPSVAHARRLVFHDAALADIVTEFNRYSTRRIEVNGASARILRFSGVFDADDAESFLQFLECCSALAVSRQGNRVVIKPRPQPVAKR